LLFIVAPSAPTNVSYLINSDNSVDLDWEVLNTTGPVKSYKLYLTLEQSLYEPIDGCPVAFKNKTMISSLKRRMRLEMLEAFSKYSLRITSENDSGVSRYSKEISFSTIPAAPDAPRKVSIDFPQLENEDGNETHIPGKLTWLAPCKPNGKISIYTIDIRGNRAGYGNHKATVASTTTETLLQDLKRGFSYKIDVQAVNSANTGGKPEKFMFEVPSGSECE